MSMAARKNIIPVFIPNWGCPYRCVYCDQKVITAQTGGRKVSGQIGYALTRVPPGAYPVEVAFYGGTFTALPQGLQKELLEAVEPYRASGMVDAVRVSTHPAFINPETLALLADYGVKTVELGVQSMDPMVLQLSGRDYGPDMVQAAVRLLKQRGFKTGIQIMPGLPGDTKEKTLDTVRRVISLQPDFVRVYPTVVISNTPLAEMYQAGKFQALSLEEAVDWCKDISRLFVQAEIPIIRMGLHPSRELETQVLAGPYHPAFKALVDSALALDQILAQVTRGGGQLVVSCNPRDIPVVRGHKNTNIIKLRTLCSLQAVDVRPDVSLPGGTFRVVVKP